MFTGLVQSVGTVRGVSRRGAEARLIVSTRLERLELGESISVAGACLTVATIRTHGFEADVSAETLACSRLGQLGAGARVNLERACRLGDRLGGHIVTGHVDAVGQVSTLQSGREAQELVVQAPAAMARYLAPKGSVAIDGVSLTVNQLVSESDGGAVGFAVMLVPHTLAKTTLLDLSPGDPVNLEADVLARYVARQLDYAARSSASPRDGTRAPSSSDEPSAGESGSDRDQVLLNKLRQGGMM